MLPCTAHLLSSALGSSGKRRSRRRARRGAQRDLAERLEHLALCSCPAFLAADASPVGAAIRGFQSERQLRDADLAVYLEAVWVAGLEVALGSGETIKVALVDEAELGDNFHEMEFGAFVAWLLDLVHTHLGREGVHALVQCVRRGWVAPDQVSTWGLPPSPPTAIRAPKLARLFGI